MKPKVNEARDELNYLMDELPDRVHVTHDLIRLLEQNGQRRPRNVFVVTTNAMYRLIGYTWNRRVILERIVDDE